MAAGYCSGIGSRPAAEHCLFSAGIVFFCFFYTALVFNPKDVADNLKKSGAFIPGIRPGEHTARYIDSVLTQASPWFGAVLHDSSLPAAPVSGGVGECTLLFGGTSLLIVVVVVMDTMAQIQSHLMSNQYESLLKNLILRAMVQAV